jgi:hypothetical protein
MKTKNTTPIATILIVIAITLQNQITPTPAPSKTPDSTQAVPTSTESDTLSPAAKTQADLSILTGNIQRPNGLTWYNSKLYTACSGDWTIYEITPETGTTNQYIYGIRNAHTLYAVNENDSLGLWVPDFQSNTLTHIQQGIVETVASNLEGPWGITQLDDQTLAITNLSGNSLIAVKQNGETKELISQLRSPTGIAIDNDYIYIANTGSTKRSIEWFSKTDILKASQPIRSSDQPANTLVTGLQNTTNLIFGPDKLLYFSYALGSRGIVGRVDPEICRANEGCTSEQVEIVLYTELAAPLAGLTISPDMRLYIHSIFSPDIYWVQLDPITNEDPSIN